MPAAPTLTLEDPAVGRTGRRGSLLPRLLVAVVAVSLTLAASWALWGRFRAFTAPSPAGPGLRAQVVTPEPAPERLPEIAANPLVLTYHDVGPDSTGPYNVTNARFAQDMASLHAAGWRTVTADAYLAWLAGEATLPERSVLLTFDDGTAGTWRYVDPILERYDAHAVQFVVTGWIGQGGYYLTWPEVHALRDTGRWEIAAHSHLGHRFVRTDAAGTEQPFLINRAWLGDGLEPRAAFRDRIRRDLRSSLRELEERGFPRPRLFAYPYAASAEPTNDPRAAAFTGSEIARLFDAAVTIDVAVFPTARPDPHDIPRLGVTAPLSLPELFAQQLQAAG